MKSVEEFLIRRSSRDIGHGDRQKLSPVEWIRLDRDWNQVEDKTAAEMLPLMTSIAADLKFNFPASP